MIKVGCLLLHADGKVNVEATKKRRLLPLDKPGV